MRYPTSKLVLAAMTKKKRRKRRFFQDSGRLFQRRALVQPYDGDASGLHAVAAPCIADIIAIGVKMEQGARVI
jgi:hypothetical protein